MKKKLKAPTEKDWGALAVAPWVGLSMPPLQMLSVFDALMVALKHHSIKKGFHANNVRTFAKKLEKRIVAVSPGMADYCKCGWKKAGETCVAQTVTNS